MIFLATLLYATWSRRNALIFKNNEGLKASIFRFNRQVEEFYLASLTDNLPSNPHRAAVSWSKPPSGYHKVNIDASFSKVKAALALVIRNFEGLVIKMAAKTYLCREAHEAEI